MYGPYGLQYGAHTMGSPSLGQDHLHIIYFEGLLSFKRRVALLLKEVIYVYIQKTKRHAICALLNLRAPLAAVMKALGW